jgi:hypothetical protein
MRAVALAIVSVLVTPVALAQEAQRSATSIECSRQADAKGLSGAERRDFRTQCRATLEGVAPKATRSRPTEQSLPMRVEPLSHTGAIGFITAIRKRWDPTGYRGPSIDVDIYLNPDGSLSAPPKIVSTPNDDPNYQTAADGIIRAITSAQPFLMLLGEPYAKRKVVKMTFDVKELAQPH